MLDKQMKKALSGKEAKDPQAQYEGSKYKFSDGKRTGFTAVGFKAAMVRAGQQLGLVMTQTRGQFHVMGEENELIEVNGEYHIREDMVRLATGVADIRFRCEYSVGWEANLTIRYLKNAISVEQLAQLITLAGFSCGVGEWRPQKSNSGSYGLFELVNQ